MLVILQSLSLLFHRRFFCSITSPFVLHLTIATAFAVLVLVALAHASARRFGTYRYSSTLHDLPPFVVVGIHSLQSRFRAASAAAATRLKLISVYRLNFSAYFLF
jgi:hypothetical protein